MLNRLVCPALAVLVWATAAIADTTAVSDAGFSRLHSPTHKGAADCLWGGTWDSDYGDIVLTQSGQSVYGNYTWDDGLIHGTVSGAEFDGNWFESPTYEGPTDSGQVEFTINSDCSRLTGRWNYVNSAEGNWVGAWNASRRSGGADALVVESQSDSLSVNGRPAPVDSVTVLADQINSAIEDQLLGSGASNIGIVCADTALVNASLWSMIMYGQSAEETLLNIASSSTDVQQLLAEACEGDVLEKAVPLHSLEMSLTRGGARFSMQVSDPELVIGTENLVLPVQGPADFAVQHVPGGTTRVVAVDTPIQITPANAALGVITLQPGFLVDVSATDVSSPLSEVVIADGFE